VSKTDVIAEVAAQVKARTLTVEAAIDRIVALAVEGAGAHLPEPVKARLRSQLEALLADDPALADRQQRIERRGSNE
jgi:hypothetical protein